MYIIEKLKLNRFKMVSIPKPCELYARLGHGNLPAENAYTGEELAQMHQRKTDQMSQAMEDYERYAKEMEHQGNEGN